MPQATMLGSAGRRGFGVRDVPDGAAAIVLGRLLGVAPELLAHRRLEPVGEVVQAS
jgi:hypothetical protein